MERTVIIDANDLLQLMLHYNDGVDIPLDAKILNVGVSPFIQRWIVFMCESENWPTGHYVPQIQAFSPLHIRYDGSHIVVIADRGLEPSTREVPDAPRRQ